MANKALTSLLFLLLTTTLLSSSSFAHNITRILSNHPEFSTFNSLLSSTDLADEINRRHTITILAVSNASIGGVVGLSPDLQRRILSIHVILDYFDLEKLQNLKNHSAILTTLFQTSGIADGQSGFLNVTKFYEGQIAFGSAASGAGLVADLVRTVASRPFNISVLQVSSIIIPPGIDGHSHNSTLPLPPPPPQANANTPVPSNAPAPAAEEPTTVADAPVAGAAPADASVADSPEVESPKGATDEKVKSGAGRAAVGASIGIIMALILIALR